MSTSNGHGKHHEKPVMATSHEYDALRRDIKAVRDQQVNDREEVVTEVRANRRESTLADERLAGQILALHKIGNGHVADVGRKVDELAELVVRHIEADAEWKATFRHRLAVEHDRTSQIENEVDVRIPSAHVLGLRVTTWKTVGVSLGTIVAATIISACVARAGVLAPVPVKSTPAIHDRQNYEGP